MKRIFSYHISLVVVILAAMQQAYSQDTLDVPLKYRIAVEVSGPAIYFSEKNILNAEANFSLDLNEKRSLHIGGGYLDYSYSQYNYSYHSKGIFLRTGIDLNLMAPEKTQGKYWAGIGLHYGLSSFATEIPFYTKDNYWGSVSSSVGSKSGLAHFIEASPGVRAEIIKNISIGWNVSLRMLLFSGTGKDLRPIYLPGFGNGAKRFSTGVSYFISWNIPYKRITVITKPPAPEEPDEETGVQPAAGTGNNFR
jgi:hypothetical protein